MHTFTIITCILTADSLRVGALVNERERERERKKWLKIRERGDEKSNI